MTHYSVVTHQTTNVANARLSLREVQVFGMPTAAVLNPADPQVQQMCRQSLLTTILALDKPSSLDSMYCWKDAQGRGVGIVPNSCPSGKEFQAGLCYDYCPSGFTGVSFVCWQNCPSGFPDAGPTCAKPWDTSSWKIWEWSLRSCQNGMTDIGLFCAKRTTTRGVGTFPICGGDTPVNDAGLCYRSCGAGQEGLGPLCWSSCANNGWVSCGAGCAKSTEVCQSVIGGQVTSVLMAASSTKNVMSTFLKNGGIRNLLPVVRAVYKDAALGMAGSVGLSLATHAARAELCMQLPATDDLWDLTALDPTGLSDVARKFYYKKCSDLW